MGPGVNLSYTDLTGATFPTGVDLTGASFYASNLSGATLGAGTSFSNADLDYVTFNGADLNGADLSGRQPESHHLGRRDRHPGGAPRRLGHRRRLPDGSGRQPELYRSGERHLPGRGSDRRELLGLRPLRLGPVGGGQSRERRARLRQPGRRRSRGRRSRRGRPDERQPGRRRLHWHEPIGGHWSNTTCPDGSNSDSDGEPASASVSDRTAGAAERTSATSAHGDMAVDPKGSTGRSSSGTR